MTDGMNESTPLRLTADEKVALFVALGVLQEKMENVTEYYKDHEDRLRRVEEFMSQADIGKTSKGTVWTAVVAAVIAIASFAISILDRLYLTR